MEINTEPTFEASKPTTLFSMNYASREHGDYDVDPTGPKFLMLDRERPDLRSGDLRIILNWFEELKAKSSVTRLGSYVNGGFGTGQHLTTESRHH